MLRIVPSELQVDFAAFPVLAALDLRRLLLLAWHGQAIVALSYSWYSSRSFIDGSGRYRVLSESWLSLPRIALMEVEWCWNLAYLAKST